MKNISPQQLWAQKNPKTRPWRQHWPSCQCLLPLEAPKKYLPWPNTIYSCCIIPLIQFFFPPKLQKRYILRGQMSNLFICTLYQYTYPPQHRWRIKCTKYASLSSCLIQAQKLYHSFIHNFLYISGSKMQHYKVSDHIALESLEKCPQV